MDVEEKEHYKHRTVEDLVQDAKDYADTRIQYFKLYALQKTSAIVADVVTMVVVAVSLLLFFMYGLVALGLWFGEMLGSYAKGFGVLVLLFLVIALVVLLARKAIERMIQNTVIKKYFNKLSEKEEATDGKKL